MISERMRKLLKRFVYTLDNNDVVKLEQAITEIEANQIPAGYVAVPGVRLRVLARYPERTGWKCKGEICPFWLDCKDCYMNWLQQKEGDER